MPGLIERYRERLPFAAEDPVVSLGEGSTPLVHAPGPVRARRGRGVVQARGAQPDGLVQGPGDDLRRLGRGARGGRGHRLRLDRQHGRLGRRLRGPGRAALRGDRARGQDRHRQARPGADARRPGDRPARQLRRGPEARARAHRRRIPSRWSTRSTSSGSRARRRRPSRSPRTLDGELDALCIPVGQRRQHHRLLARVRGARAAPRACSASRPPARRRSCSARRWSSPRPWPARSGSAIRPAGRTR